MAGKMYRMREHAVCEDFKEQCIRVIEQHEIKESSAMAFGALVELALLVGIGSLPRSVVLDVLAEAAQRAQHMPEISEH